MSNYIYEPRGKAREFCALAINTYTTCAHGCVYCYAPLALKKGRERFHQACPRVIDWQAMEREAQRKADQGWTAKGPVLLSFACDPYQPLEDTEHATDKAVCILKAAGFALAILTKDTQRAWKYAENLDPDRDMVGTTITSLYQPYAIRWEPGAPAPQTRDAYLWKFHEAGFFTWVSLEPMIDPHQIEAIISRTSVYVNHYKIGALNYGNTCPEIRDHAARFDWRRHALNIEACFATYGFTVNTDPDAWQNKSYYPKASFIKLMEEET